MGTEATGKAAAFKSKITRVTLEGMEGTQLVVACNDLKNAERNLRVIMARRADELMPIVRALHEDVSVVSKAFKPDDSAVLGEKHMKAMLGTMEHCVELCRSIINRKDEVSFANPDRRYLGYMVGVMERVQQFGKCVAKMIPEDSPEVTRVQEMAAMAEEYGKKYNPQKIQSRKLTISSDYCDRLDALCDKIAQSRSAGSMAR